jgi:hypothetical protein
MCINLIMVLVKHLKMVSWKKVVNSHGEYE